MSYEEVRHSLEDLTINNAIGLLDEVLMNAALGPDSLYVWVQEERQLIADTISDLHWVKGDNYI